MLPRALVPYAIFYFCFYGGLGAYTPYVSRFVEALGHGGGIAGVMLGIWYGSRIVAPPLWGRLVEDSDHPGRWFIGGCVAITLAFAAFTVTEGVVGLFGVMLLFGLAYNALMPQCEAMTLQTLGAQARLYGRVRVWGSISFMLVAAVYGSWLDRLGARAFPWLTLPWFVAMCLAALPWLGMSPSAARSMRTSPIPFIELWRRKGAAALFWMAFLTQTGFGAFYVFFTLHLQRAGHDGLAIGLLWAVGVLVEIAVFFLAPSLLARFPVNRLIAICLWVTMLRWLLTAWLAESFATMLLLPSTHALGYALLHACTMARMAAIFPGGDGARGQSLLYGFSSGGGGVIGALLAAVLWEWHGGPAAFVGGALATLAAWIVIHGLPRRQARALA